MSVVQNMPDRRSKSLLSASLLLNWAPGLLVIGAMTFNAILAAINGNVRPLTSFHVIAAEILLVSAAMCIILSRHRPEMTRWYVLIGIFCFFAILRSFATYEFEFKFLRDILIVPVFILLGMTFDVRRLDRIVLIVTTIVLVAFIFEVISTSAYADFFKIQTYYINTRGFEADEFWNKEATELFLSVGRPDERLFSFINLHRLSSVFLEPVSLGNYGIIIVIYLCARFHAISKPARRFLIVGALAAIIGSDGRLAALSSAMIIMAAFIAPRLPYRSAFLYIPAILAFTALVVYFADYRAGTDDFPGRIAYTVELLAKYEVSDLLGVSDRYVSQAADSGIAYFIGTQSLFGLALWWGFVVFGGKEETRDQIQFIHALGLYVALTLIVSFAIFSIKTASLLWFIYGVLQPRETTVPGRIFNKRQGFIMPTT